MSLRPVPSPKSTAPFTGEFLVPSALLSAAVELAPHAQVLGQDKNHSLVLTYANKQFIELTGIDLKASTGLRLRDLLEVPSTLKDWESIDRQLAVSRPFEATLPIARPDGTLVWQKLQFTPLNDTANTWSAILFELPPQDPALEILCQQLSQGFAVLDYQDRVLKINPIFARLIEQDPANVVGKPINVLLSAVVLARSQTTQGVPAPIELHLSSQPEPVVAELTTLNLPASGPARRLLILTERRDGGKTNYNRIQEYTQLESLGTLAAGISHDFNNLLAIIQGYASLLRDSASDPARLGHYADTILDAGRRGADVVRQLQLFANTHDSELSSSDIHALLHNLIDRNLATWPQNIAITRQFTAEDPILTVDPIQVIQAVQRLLDNAREAMPTGGQLTIRTSESRQSIYSAANKAAEYKAYLRVTIQDTGQGMDAATRARMFEPFFAKNKGPETRGLGLAVVHGIMRAHRGLIEVESSPGHGTTLHLLFPQHQPVEARPTSSSASPFTPEANRRTILLVEDEQDLGALWGELLPMSGWRILWARDGAEGIRLFRAHRDEIALVFTDIGLPVLDGWHVSDTIRAEVPGMPLLIASGAFRPGDRQRGYANPVTYLSKPYVPSKVLLEIDQLVSKNS